MLQRLHEIEALLPSLLLDVGGWKTKLIDYHPPKVERLYRDLDGDRILLHRIHPCEPGEALFHPHPWPSAIAIVEGGYEMGVGQGQEAPRKAAATLVLAPGSRYEMTDPLGWHWVRPLDRPSLSVMVTGPVWPAEVALEAPRTGNYPFPPLSEEARDDLLAAFRRHYPVTPSRPLR